MVGQPSVAGVSFQTITTHPHPYTVREDGFDFDLPVVPFHGFQLDRRRDGERRGKGQMNRRIPLTGGKGDSHGPLDDIGIVFVSPDHRMRHAWIVFVCRGRLIDLDR